MECNELEDNLEFYRHEEVVHIYKGRKGFVDVILAKVDGRWCCGAEARAGNEGYKWRPSTYLPSYLTRDKAIRAACTQMVDYQEERKVLEAIGKDAVRAVWTAAHYRQTTIFDFIKQ